MDLFSRFHIQHTKAAFFRTCFLCLNSKNAKKLNKIKSKKRCCPTEVWAVSSPPVFTDLDFSQIPLFTLPFPPLPHLTSLHPLRPLSATGMGQDLFSAPAGFNIHCSTSQRIAQFSVFFFFRFFFLLILFKFDAVLVLVWYTLYKIYEYEHQLVSPRNLLKHVMAHTQTHFFSLLK